jgi:predicted GIY-YIG superfamily endonuclease
MKLYIVRCLVTDLIKIGITKDAGKRLKQLQTGSPTQLHLVKTFNVEPAEAHRIEAKIHRLCKSYHSHGEWFQKEAEATVRSILQ